MNAVVFGASGRTGRELVEQGLARGHNVTAFVRNPSRFAVEHPRLRVVRGDVADRTAVDAAIKGQDAVICALGSKTLLRRDEAFVVGVHNIVIAMESLGVRRLIYLSADTVREARPELNALRKLIVAPVLHNSSADHELNEGMVRQSRLDWTIVRPPMLTDGSPTGAYRTGEHLKAGAIIPRLTRADLAASMLDELDDAAPLHVALEVMQ